MDIHRLGRLGMWLLSRSRLQYYSTMSSPLEPMLGAVVQPVQEDVEQSQIAPNRNGPRKRIIVYGLIIALLSLIGFSVNIIVSLLHDLADNEKLWQYLNSKKCLCNLTLEDL
jgi:hypothetical protein